MRRKRKTNFVQYSKKMCTGVTIFWMLYRLINFLVIWLSPGSAAYLSELCSGVDTVMIVNMSVYTTNSTVEKVSLAWFKRGQRNDEDDEKENEQG